MSFSRMWQSRSKTVTDAVREILTYFSLFSYPLTPLEVWRFVFLPASYEAVVTALEELTSAGAVLSCDGKFVLAGHAGVFCERESRYRISLRKLQRARRAVSYLSRLPFVRAVYVCNSLALFHADEASDIDLFIIVREGMIWRARFFSVLPFLLFGIRPGVTRRDPLCFSFFLSDQSLDVSRFRIGAEDPYLALWIATLLPLHDPDGLLRRMYAESDIHSALPQLREFSVRSVGRPHFAGYVKPHSVFERILRRLQYWWFPKRIREQIGQGTEVVVADAVIKLHTNDRRAAYLKDFLRALRME